MDIVFSEKHGLQDGRAELVNGELKPCFEAPVRAEMVRAALASHDLGRFRDPDPLPEGALARIHDPAFLAFLEGAWDRWSAAGRTWDALPLNWRAKGMRFDRAPDSIDGQLSHYSFDAGTPITAGTWAAVTSSAAVALTGAGLVAGGAPVAFSLCRPPGHHAGTAFYGGYCFLNNAALAVQALRDAGAERVALLDVDYHHGNGSQEIFYGRDDVLFVSLHGDPMFEFPFFLGHADETGEGAGEGFNLNLPLPAGTGWPDYRTALEHGLARIRDFAPDAVVVSLGLDTFKADPISQFKLESESYPEMGGLVAGLGRPTLLVMEGGYAVDDLGLNTARFVEGFRQVVG
ncbi:histone deacetylase family protein [Roseospirillum parvum]|uniref:Acetoin utilization deacetylase AcuC n=1 Tax=Roseospirillum parvum TaxID=83401 RepID=A0A1G7TPK4_9PROT|nr:histone deacetylase family protein [Roseospirillum parvum]SDG36934.1 Acetoin utilization deacetylase AcuC [Roseospirillum parvum]